MNLARGFEKRLENLVDGVSASVFRGKMHPVTIASRLVRQLDFLATETPAGLEIPNDLTITIHPADFDSSVDVGTLEDELDLVVADAALQNGWRLVGPATVHLTTSSDVPRGILQCSGEIVRGTLPDWGQLIADDASAVVGLTMNSQIIGRALDCDIRFSNSEISRYHAIIERSMGVVTIRDLGSANGTAINGDRIFDDAVAVVPGAQVAFGGIPFTYRAVS